MNGQGPFYGKYRGEVTNNRDPEKLGRLRLKVRDIFGDHESGWALPCVPFAGKGLGFFMLPPENALVWVEFENGDPDYPIWSGCFWAAGETPTDSAEPEKKVIKTEAGTIILDETVGNNGITIETKEGMKIILDMRGIEINDGKGGTIKLVGNQVSINDGALEVT
jgi:uncharacterized protein involved in type VI secretion and phage assembly